MARIQHCRDPNSSAAAIHGSYLLREADCNTRLKGYAVAMSRLFVVVLVLLATLCQGQVPAGGTLVAVVPANGGIIVAADTRSTVAQTYCDGQAKLFVPRLRKRTVVFQTGQGLQLPLSGALPVDLCRYLRSTSPLLDIANFLVHQLDAKPKQVLTQTETQEIAGHCVSEVIEFAHKNEALHPLNPYLGQDMFRAAIVSYDATRETGLLGSFIIRVDSLGAPVLGEVQWREFLKADKTDDDVNSYGETEYVGQCVYKLSQQFLGPYKALSSKTVSQISLSAATSAALSLITAAEETAKSVTPPYGIGGPIDVATITRKGTVLVRH